MSCKDCIHYDVCVIVEHSDTDYDHYSEYGCEDFKNKADFVEVVRCEKCKHYEAVKKHNDDFDGWCVLYDGLTCKNDFCSYGERRDEE